MNYCVYAVLCLCVIFYVQTSVIGVNPRGAEFEDNEFAEFEDFDDGSSKTVNDVKKPILKADKPEPVADTKPSQASPTADDEDAVVETEDDEFATLDPDEFEGLTGDDTIWENGKTMIKNKKMPELKIADVPLRSRSWDKYYLEILMTVALTIYFTNFLLGKTKNNSIAAAWLHSHVDFLCSQFELVGDDPQNKRAESTLQLVKDSEHAYTLWCSGRQCCEGMLVQLKLLKRQDLISVIAQRISPGTDQVRISVTLESMDLFVFCVGLKRSVLNLQKTMTDVNQFCTDKLKQAEKYGLSPNWCIASELPGEVTAHILDSKVIKVLKDNEQFFDSLHISDQFCGPKPTDQDEQPTKAPETTKKIIMVCNIPLDGDTHTAAQQLLPLTKTAIYLTDKVRKFKLSKESRARAEKHRQDVHLRYLKITHAQRQEAAQLKKEEKARALKDRMMNEEDPEKQRRLDEMIQRRELNKKNKKMMKGRQYKVKAM